MVLLMGARMTVPRSLSKSAMTHSFTRGDSHARLCLVLQQVLLGVQVREQVLRRHPMEGCNHATLDHGLPCYATLDVLDIAMSDGDSSSIIDHG